MNMLKRKQPSSKRKIRKNLNFYVKLWKQGVAKLIKIWGKLQKFVSQRGTKSWLGRSELPTKFLWQTK